MPRKIPIVRGRRFKRRGGGGGSKGRRARGGTGGRDGRGGKRKPKMTRWNIKSKSLSIEADVSLDSDYINDSDYDKNEDNKNKENINTTNTTNDNDNNKENDDDEDSDQTMDMRYLAGKRKPRNLKPSRRVSPSINKLLFGKGKHKKRTATHGPTGPGGDHRPRNERERLHMEKLKRDIAAMEEKKKQQNRAAMYTSVGM